MAQKHRSTPSPPDGATGDGAKNQGPASDKARAERAARDQELQRHYLRYQGQR